MRSVLKSADVRFVKLATVNFDLLNDVNRFAASRAGGRRGLLDSTWCAAQATTRGESGAGRGRGVESLCLQLCIEKERKKERERESVCVCVYC